MMSALGTLLVVQSSSPAQAVAFISMALFCVHFAGTSAWGLVQVMVSETKVASIAGIQNFGSFVFASFAPIVTGWVVDTTHSFNLALVIAACVTFTGALCYFFIVKIGLSNRYYQALLLWACRIKKADPGDPQKFTLALVIRVEKLSKRAVTSRVKRGAAPFL